MLKQIIKIGCCLALLAAGATALWGERRISSTGDERPTAALSPEASVAPINDWDRRWWLDKTARMLRGGKGIGPDDDAESLLRLTNEEIVRRFMADRRFADTVLDFNLFVLGFKSDSLRSGTAYDRAVFGFPNAIASAKAIARGGDYLKLLDLVGPFYMAPLRSEPLEDAPAKADAGLTPAQMRAKVLVELEAEFSQMSEKLRKQSNPATACASAKAMAARTEELTDRVHRGYDDSEIFVIIRGRMLSSPLEALSALVEAKCGKGPRNASTGQSLAAGIDQAWHRIDVAFAELARFETAVYQPAAVDEFRSFDLSAFPEPVQWVAFGFEQGLALGNSSTNFNRKRSAYVLKRFFCDDLVPIGAEEPKAHAAGGEHGSETSCFACHYKLDPMAGFFRNYGAYFYDYSTSPFVIFDDLVSTDRAAYEDYWRVKTGETKKLNVGFIRSPRWDQHNTYGQNMSDLSRILRGAPEVKRCLMRRLVEYFVADEQAIDSGYLDDLTSQFTADARENSATAIKNAMVRVIQSAAYRQRDADPSRCYDFAGPAQPPGGPPCRVASLLAKNCAQCHGGGVDQEGGLDLSSWVEMEAASGVRRSAFPHVDAKGVQIAPRDTLARMAERLAINDPRRRMPLQRVMPGQERQELYLWVQDELTRLGAEAPR